MKKHTTTLPAIPVNKLPVIFLLIAFFVIANAFYTKAQQAESMTLQQCIDYTLKNQASVKNAQLDQMIAQKRVNEILGLGLPQINGSLDVQDMIERPTQLLPGEFFGSPPGTFVPIQFGTKYNATANLSASQLIFDGSYILGVKASTVYVNLARKNLERTKIDAIEAVQKAYYSVIINKERQKLLEANVTRLRRVHAETKALYENGFAEKIDADRIAVTLSNLEVENEKVIRLMEVSDYLLKFQMGMPVQTPLVLTDSLRYTEMLAISDEKTDYNRRIEYSLLETQKEFLGFDVRRHRSAYLPSLAAYGSYSTQAMRNEFDFFDRDKNWFPIAIIGAKLNVPIFNGFQTHARIQQAKLTVQKTENDQINLQNLIDFQVYSSRTTYENAYKTLNAQQKNMELAQEIASVTQIKFKEGVGSNLEVVTAETELRQAQTNYFDALYNTIIANIDYQKAKGTLLE